MSTNTIYMNNENKNIVKLNQKKDRKNFRF